MIREGVFIGIDPDIDRSGIAVLRIDENCIPHLEYLNALPLLDLVAKVSKYRNQFNLNVYVEAGWLNEATWHLPAGVSARKAAAIGKAVGANHQIGKDICSLLRDAVFSVDEKKPLPKCWKGHDRKISHEELAMFVSDLPKRTNQEERDALLLAWVCAGLPIRMTKLNGQ